jgi:hypothetical protein
VAGNKDARTGDKESGIAKIFDADKVTKEVNAQIAITGEFGKRAAKEVGEYAGKKRDELKQQAKTETDPAKKTSLLAEADKWEEGGMNRVALHTAVGMLTGGFNGAAGAASSQMAVPVLGDMLKEANLPVELKEALILTAGTLIATGTGGTAGAGAGLNATGNNYLTHAQLQSKKQQLDACKTEACKKEITSTWDKVNQSANGRVQDKVLQSGEAANLKTMEQLSSDMNGLAQYKAGLDEQLRATTDPTQRATLQLQVNEADNNMRQIANLGKDTLALMYQQTGNPAYQNAYQALTAATSGNELGSALALPGGSGGNINKAVEQAKPGVNVAEQAANAAADAGKLAKAETVVADAAKGASKVPNSPVDIAHTIGADYNARTGKVTGGHSLLNNDVKVTEVVNPPDGNGVYQALVQLQTPDGNWVTKTDYRGQPQKNTMFPKTWDAAKIQAQVDSAWNNPAKTIDPKTGQWTAKSDSGVTIQGYTQPKATAYPLYEKGK